jgi:hypothetical protein
MHLRHDLNHYIVEIRDILFSVVYFDGNRSIVRDGSWIHEKAQPIRHILPLLSIFALPNVIRKEEMLHIALPTHRLAENPSV